MNKKAIVVLLLLCTVLAGAAETGTIWIIPIRGDIEPSMAAFVRREAQRALRSGAEYLVFEIDTFGGRVDSALHITSFITSITTARTVAWVHSGDESMGVSWSAGALIAFSCDAIYMAAGTSLGAAAPVIEGSDGLMESAGEKTVAALRSQMAALAERNGHPVGIALAMVDMDTELWEVQTGEKTHVMTIDELEPASDTVTRIKIISPKGKLLSLTSGEAVRYGLAAGQADDQDALITALDAGNAVVNSAPSIADGFLSLLNSGPVQVILIIIGIVMIFLEINTPGFGIPGVVAILAFLALFGPGLLVGQVNSWEIILFLVGIAFLTVEIFITPGFGLMGISGIVFIGLSLVLSMQDFIIPVSDWEWGILGRNITMVGIGIVMAITGIAIIALLGPKIRLFNRLTLNTQITGTAGGPDPDTAEKGCTALIGLTGITVSTLRPAGKANFAGQVYAVESEGEFIDRGRFVVVTRVQGNRINVKFLDSLHLEEPATGSA